MRSLFRDATGKERNEMIYLMTLSKYLIYGYVA